MNKTQLLSALEKSLMLDAGTLALTSELGELKVWDSMAILEFQALADETFDMQVDPSHIAACKTVDELFGLLGAAVKE